MVPVLRFCAPCFSLTRRGVKWRAVGCVTERFAGLVRIGRQRQTRKLTFTWTCILFCSCSALSPRAETEELRSLSSVQAVAGAAVVQ